MVWGYDRTPAGSRDPEVRRRIRQALESTASVLAWVSQQLSFEEGDSRQEEIPPRPTETVTLGPAAASASAMIQAMRSGMFDSEPYRWVLSFDDVREVFGTLRRAKEELLRHLFWMARDVIDSDPSLYQEIMRTWEEVSKIHEASNSLVVYNFTVDKTHYKLIRQDFES